MRIGTAQIAMTSQPLGRISHYNYCDLMTAVSTVMPEVHGSGSRTVGEFISS